MKKFRKGIFLLQTLVLCVIMSMIAVMVLKWVMARYMISARIYNSSAAKIKTEGCYSKINAERSDFSSMPGSGSCVIDGITVSYTKSGTRINYTSKED